MSDTYSGERPPDRMDRVCRDCGTHCACACCLMWDNENWGPETVEVTVASEPSSSTDVLTWKRRAEAAEARLVKADLLAKAAEGLFEGDHINLGLNDGWALKLALDAYRPSGQEGQG